MKVFRWDNEKNERIKELRGISFEEVVLSIERGALLDILEHTNKKKYPGQRMFVVSMRDYVFLVPFVETEREIFLKTIIPSRKATKLYLRGSTNE